MIIDTDNLFVNNKVLHELSRQFYDYCDMIESINNSSDTPQSTRSYRKADVADEIGSSIKELALLRDSTNDTKPEPVRTMGDVIRGIKSESAFAQFVRKR